MKPEGRALNPLLGASKGYMRLEPKGVIGNMAAWNFPFEIACGSPVEMLSAGNRVIIKPSEVTPNCALLLQEMIAEYYEPELVTTCIGGVEVAEHFSTLRWDHLVYTGNSRIARKVAHNCTKNLVPVTLELGGKSPAIVDNTRLDAEAARLIMGMKMTKRGQVCINVDHLYVPRANLRIFTDILIKDIQEHYEQNNAAMSACAIVSDRHQMQQHVALNNARKNGAEIITFGDPDPGWARNMPFSLVIDPPEDIDIMQNEIFGPVLPVIPYDSEDHLLEMINNRESPLGVYIFSNDDDFVQNVIDNTRSGGVSVNAAGAYIQHELGFGGVGESGMGRHHGIEGFREFSNQRAIVHLRKAPGFKYIIPPYDENTQDLLKAVYGETKDQIGFALKLIPKNIAALFKK